MKRPGYEVLLHHRRNGRKLEGWREEVDKEGKTRTFTAIADLRYFYLFFQERQVETAAMQGSHWGECVAPNSGFIFVYMVTELLRKL